MSSTDSDASASPVQVYRIPSILTTSAAEMLQYFGDDIIEFKAAASTQVENDDPIMRDYGLLWKQRQSQRVEFDYREVMNTDGFAQNPLDEDAISDILDEVDRRLTDDEIDADPDLAVTKMVIEVECPELTDVLARSHTDKYTLTFKSDPITDSEVRSKTEDLNRGKSLYHDLKFKKRNLNLRLVEETRAKYTEQGNSVMMSWQGPDDIRPDTDPRLARIIRDEILPDEFTDQLKHMVVTEEDKLKTTGLGNGPTADGDEEAENDE